MTVELNLKSDRPLEFAFGVVKPEKQQWLAREYFPIAGPIIAEYGFERLVGFGVVASNFDEFKPQTGAFGSWPSAEAREKLHLDQRFLQILPERDKALDMSDGHLFQAIDEVIALNTDQDYLVTISDDDVVVGDPIISLPLSPESPERVHAGKSISLRPWKDADKELLKTDPTQSQVLRIRFEAPQ